SHHRTLRTPPPLDPGRGRPGLSGPDPPRPTEQHPRCARGLVLRAGLPVLPDGLPPGFGARSGAGTAAWCDLGVDRYPPVGRCGDRGAAGDRGDHRDRPWLYPPRCPGPARRAAVRACSTRTSPTCPGPTTVERAPTESVDLPAQVPGLRLGVVDPFPRADRERHVHAVPALLPAGQGRLRGTVPRLLCDRGTPQIGRAHV